MFCLQTQQYLRKCIVFEPLPLHAIIVVDGEVLGQVFFYK